MPTHLTLEKNAPIREVQLLGGIAARPILGGLHHRYVRIEILTKHRTVPSLNLSSDTFASLRSEVSKPWVNHWKISASTFHVSSFALVVQHMGKTRSQCRKTFLRSHAAGMASLV